MKLTLLIHKLKPHNRKNAITVEIVVTERNGDAVTEVMWLS